MPKLPLTATTPLRYEDFIAWAESYEKINPKLSLGIPVSASSCPLSRWVRETFNVDAASVGIDSLVVRMPGCEYYGPSYPLPDWAFYVRRFVDHKLGDGIVTPAGVLLNHLRAANAPA